MHNKPHIRRQPFSTWWECHKTFAPSNPFHDSNSYLVTGRGPTPALAYVAFLKSYRRALAAGRITEVFDAK
jgi:hypothetical protein